MPGNATLFKEGFIMKKNIMDGPHKKGLLHTHHTHTRTVKPIHLYRHKSTHNKVLFVCALFRVPD